MAIARTEARAHTTAPDRTDGRPDRRPVWLSAAGLVGALASTSCCILPVALFAAGVSGAWIGRLTALAPYQPLFLTPTLLCLGVGFVMVYRSSRAACASGTSCGQPGSRRGVLATLWVATALVAAAVAFPYAVRALTGD